MALRRCVVILSLIYQVGSYPSGAPLSTCFTQYPKHGSSGTQTGHMPFVFTLTPPNYSPGQEITIKVADSSGNKIRGIQIAARRATGNEDEIVGRFVDYPSDKLKTFNCFGGYQNMLTHNRKEKVSSFTFKWKAPDKNVGNVVFRSTVLRSYRTYWYNVTTYLPVNINAPAVTAPTYPMIPLSNRVTPIDFHACGEEKGCFFYPRHCSGSNCIAVASHLYRPASKDYLFELHSNNHADYISLGFSHDQKMGEDVTVSCTGNNGKMSVQEGWNPGHHNDRNFDLFSSFHEVSYVDGDLQCHFILPETFSIYRMKQDPDSFTYTNKSWDLNKEWYLFLAWGKTMPDSDVLAKHHDLPAISNSKVDLKKNVITHSSAFHIMVRAHASLMMVAWILLTGLVTVVSRHYRDWLPMTRFLGTKVWFQIHRGLAILVVLLTVIGIILIFSHYGSGIRTFATPHAQVGLTVVACVGAQMLAGLFRPGGEHKLRPVFNWVHRFMGHATHILSAVTMFLAFDISYITSDVRRYGFIVLSVWVIIQVLWHALFEVITWRLSTPENSDTYALQEDGDTEVVTPKTTSQSSSHYSILFIVYLICLISVCVAAHLAFLLY